MTSKKEQIKKITNFITSCPMNIPIDVEQFLPILQKHPNYQEKAEGLLYWFVKINSYGKKSLFIKKKDEDVSFSYVYCLYPINKRTDFFTALRTEIHPQITSFKDTISNVFTCPLCDKLTERADCHIDHIIFFKDLAERWCEANNITIDTPISHNNSQISLEDRELAGKWANYHQQHATLRAVCSRCNLTRRYKDLPP